MNNLSPFSIRLPRTIVFGAGKIADLPSFLPENFTTVLLVAGTHTLASGDISRVRAVLEQSGLKTCLYSGVPSEPPPNAVDAIAEASRVCCVDGIVALGGGSVMDAAKAAASLVNLKGSCDDYFSGKSMIDGTKRIFLAALPTTSGTGAEMTSNAVLSDTATKVKKSLRHPSMTPELALVDPELTFACPSSVTAASGLDALVQAVESYISPRASDMTRTWSRQAVVLICGLLKRCCECPDDAEARAGMAKASMLAGMAFANCGLGAVHGLAHPVGSLLHVPHGVACAVLMMPVFRFNEPVCGGLFCELASAIKADDISSSGFLNKLQSLAESVGTPCDFKSYGLSPEHYPFIIANCRSASMKNNPRFMSDAEVEAILCALS